MGCIGATVIVKSTKMLGTLLGWNHMMVGFVDVMVWDSFEKKYECIPVHPMNVEEIKNPLVFMQTNGEDREMDDLIHAAMIDVALDTGDQAWFLELIEQKAKPKKERALTPEELRSIKVGTIVADLRGLNLGIVVGKSKEYADQVLVQTWLPGMKKYLQFHKRIDLLNPVEHPRLIDWMNRTANHQDAAFRESLRLAFSILAVQTDDRAWFDEVNKGEMSDGA